jgi:hypothetical protein
MMKKKVVATKAPIVKKIWMITEYFCLTLLFEI